MSLEFEWDEEKSRVNQRTDDVSFEDACTVLAAPLSLTIPDPETQRRRHCDEGSVEAVLGPAAVLYRPVAGLSRS
jgi:uncharacterized DUF497 family protein